MGLAALGAIFTGLIGNYIALSRLLRSMSEDGMLSGGSASWMRIRCRAMRSSA
jgi:hypothetical protein